MSHLYSSKLCGFWYPKYEHQPKTLRGAQGELSTLWYWQTLRTQLQPYILVWRKRSSSTLDIRGEIKPETTSLVITNLPFV